jgi:hypothetical protein
MSIHLDILSVPPNFTLPPKNVEINPYASVNLTCVAVGSPMPKIKFMDGPRELTPEDEVHWYEFKTVSSVKFQNLSIQSCRSMLSKLKVLSIIAIIL